MASLAQSLISLQSPFRTQDKDEGSVPEQEGGALAQPHPRSGEVRRAGGRRQDGGPGRGRGGAGGGVSYIQRDIAPHPQHQGHQPFQNKTPGK